jgi:hypothetical protein
LALPDELRWLDEPRARVVDRLLLELAAPRRLLLLLRLAVCFEELRELWLRVPLRWLVLRAPLRRLVLLAPPRRLVLLRRRVVRLCPGRASVTFEAVCLIALAGAFARFSVPLARSSLPIPFTATGASAATPAPAATPRTPDSFWLEFLRVALTRLDTLLPTPISASLTAVPISCRTLSRTKICSTLSWTSVAILGPLFPRVAGYALGYPMRKSGNACNCGWCTAAREGVVLAQISLQAP